MDDNRKLLEELQGLTIQELIAQIRTGEASAGLLGVARQLLKDNDVVCSLSAVSTLEGLTEELMKHNPLELTEEDMQIAKES